MTAALSLRPILALALVIFISSCDKPAPTKTASPAPSAPATNSTTYLDLFSQIPKDTNMLIGNVTFTASGPTFDSTMGGTIDQAFDLLRQRQDIILKVLTAAAHQSTPLGLPGGSAEDPEALAFTGQFRAAARLLNADAARQWSEGDVDAAVSRIEAIYGICSHAAEEQTVLMALVTAAVEMLANQTSRHMAQGAGGKALSQAQKDRLLKAISRLHGADPSGMIRARQAEQVSDPALLQSLQQTETQIKQDLAATKRALRGE